MKRFQCSRNAICCYYFCEVTPQCFAPANRTDKVHVSPCRHIDITSKGDVHTLLLFYTANHQTLFTEGLFRADQVDTAMMLTYIGINELPGWISAPTTLLFCVSHSEFTQSLSSDARQCSIRPRPIPSRSFPIHFEQSPRKQRHITPHNKSVAS